MKTYIPNNINFRIVSSNSIAKFKQDQSYDFFEIVKLGDLISPPAKEVILLEYDHWFKWILKLEKIFLLVTEDDSNESIYNQVELLLQSEMDDIYEIMSVYTNFFNFEFTKFIHFVHKYSLESLQRGIKDAIINNDLGVSFSKIVFYISIYLQQILMAVQEFETVLRKEEHKTADLFYSGWCREMCALSGNRCDGICPVAERAKYYNKHDGTNKFVLHNMTKDPLTADCITKVNQLDIEVIDVKNEHVVGVKSI